MRINFNKIQKAIGTRLGFVLTLLIIYWFKTLLAYTVDFNLDIQLGKLQGNYLAFIAFWNPLPLGLLLLALALYARPTKLFYSISIALYSLLFIWLYSNVFYYREFSDFITANTIKVVSKVSVGTAELELLRLWDFIYFMDFPLLAFLLYKKCIQLDKRPFKFRSSVAITALSTLLFSANLFLAEIERPDLLSRGFSNYYVVRALSLPAFLGYSANQSYSANKERAKASETDLQPITDYIQEHSAKLNPDYFGLAKGKNVIYLHLESFQQFLLDYKLNLDGTEHEVTPFLNSLYHSQSTLAFSNIFNQVKAGKTSDAETMLETGLFGLDQGSFMVNYGGTNTQQAAPFILSKNGYQSSAVFHGNIGTFWNRNTTYKQWGYQYFFDASYFTKQNSSNSFQYGLNDKIMMKDSIQYLEHLQQPFMVVMPDYEKGQIINTYGGQIDILPTLEHILGIESSSFLQVGQDLLSPDHQEIVAFRTANSFVTPKYTSYDGRTYYTESGIEINNLDEQAQTELENIRQAASQQLKISDHIQTGDLIRFYQADHLGKVDTESISYLNSLPILQKIEQEKGSQSTSLFSQQQGKTSTDLFKHQVTKNSTQIRPKPNQNHNKRCSSVLEEHLFLSNKIQRKSKRKLASG